MLALAAPCATPAASAAYAYAPAAAASATSAAVPASAWVAHHVLPQLAAAWAVAAARGGGTGGAALRMVAVAQPLLAAACAVLPAQAQVRLPSHIPGLEPGPCPNPEQPLRRAHLNSDRGTCEPDPGPDPPHHNHALTPTGLARAAAVADAYIAAHPRSLTCR